jgi:hypothetical protein
LWRPEGTYRTAARRRSGPNEAQPSTMMVYGLPPRRWVFSKNEREGHKGRKQRGDESERTVSFLNALNGATVNHILRNSNSTARLTT